MNNTLNQQIHLFEYKNLKIAFGSENYRIAVLDESKYSSLNQYVMGGTVSPNEQQNIQDLCNSLTNYIQSKPISIKEPVSQKPISLLCLLITSKCNIQCEYCFNHQGEYELGVRQVMSLETACKSVDFLLENCGKSCGISFFGGEPLTQFELIKQVVEYAESQAKSRNIQIGFHVTTNGILINSSVAQYLKEHRFTVIVSIDGDEKAHDFHRVFANGNGTYALSVKGAKTLVQEFGSQSGITIRGTFTHHQKRLTESFKHLAENGFENISIEPATGDVDSDYSIKPDDISDIYSEYENLSTIYKNYVKGENGANKASYFHFQKPAQNILSARNGKKPCGAAVGYLAVSPDGSLYPCHRIVEEEFRLGDVYNGIVNTQISQRFDNATTETRPECSACWAKKICGGGCYANSISNNQDMLDCNEMECLLTKKRIEIAIGMIVENRADSILIQKSDIQVQYLNCVWCESSCQTSCEGSCQTSCEGNCQSWCEGSCQSSCEGNCQSSCESNCQSDLLWKM
jgi:uncharacterized protein